MEFDDEFCGLVLKILSRLHNVRRYGGKHTSIVRTYRSVPGHLRGKAKGIIDFLIKKGFILPKTTVEDIHVRLNEEKAREIEAICKASSVKEIRKILELA